MNNQNGWRSDRGHILEYWEDEYWSRGISRQCSYPYRNSFSSVNQRKMLEIHGQETYHELQTFESHVQRFHTPDSVRYHSDKRKRAYHTPPRRYNHLENNFVDPYRKWDNEQVNQRSSHYDTRSLHYRNAQPVTAQVPVKPYVSESMPYFHNTPPARIFSKSSSSSSKTKVNNKKNTKTLRNDKNLMDTSSNGNIKTDKPPSSKVKIKDSKSEDSKLSTVADTEIYVSSTMQDMKITSDVIIDANSEAPLMPIETFAKLPRCKISNQIEESNKSLLSNISTCDYVLEDSIDKVACLTRKDDLTVSGKEQNSDFMSDQKDVISQASERGLSTLKQNDESNKPGEFPSTVSLTKVMDFPDLQKRSPISCEASTSHNTRSDVKKTIMDCTLQNDVIILHQDLSCQPQNIKHKEMSKPSNGNYMKIDGNGSTPIPLDEDLHSQSSLKSHRPSCEQVICISSESESDNASDKMCAVDKSLLPCMQAKSLMCSAFQTIEDITGVSNTKINSSPLPSERGCGKHNINVFKTPDHYPCPNPNCGLQDSGNVYPLNKTESVVQLKNYIGFGNHSPSQLNSIKHKEVEDVPISNSAPTTQQLKLQDYSESEKSNLDVEKVSSDIVEPNSPLVTSAFVTLQEPSKDLVTIIVNNNVEQVSTSTTSEASVFKSEHRKDINTSGYFTDEAVKQTGMSNSLMTSIQKDNSSFKRTLKLINSDKIDNQEMIDTTPQKTTEKIHSNSGEKYKSSIEKDFDNKYYTDDVKRYGNHRISKKVNYGGSDFVKDKSNTDKRRIYNRNNAINEYPSKQTSNYRYTNQYDRKPYYHDIGRLDKRTVSHKHYTIQDNLQDGRSSSEDVSEERRSTEIEDLVEMRASSNDNLEEKTCFIKYSSRKPYKKSASDERRSCRKFDSEGRICSGIRFSSNGDSREQRSARRYDFTVRHDSGGRQSPGRYDSKMRRSFRKHNSEKRQSPGKCHSNERRLSRKDDHEQEQIPQRYHSKSGKSKGKSEWRQSSSRYYSKEIKFEKDGSQHRRFPGRYDSKEGRSYRKDDCNRKQSIGRYASKNDISVQNLYPCKSDSQEGASSTKGYSEERQSPSKCHSKEKRSSRKDSSQERRFSGRKYSRKDNNEESRHSRIVNTEDRRHHGRNYSEDWGSSKIECDKEGRYHERYYGENYSKNDEKYDLSQKHIKSNDNENSSMDLSFNADKFNNFICDENVTKPFELNSAAVNKHEENEHLILVKDGKTKDFSQNVIQQNEVNLIAKIGNRSTDATQNKYSESKNSKKNLNAKQEICSMDKDKKMAEREIDSLDKTVTDQQSSKKNLNINLLLNVAKHKANVTQKKCREDEILTELQHSEVQRCKGSTGFATSYETCSMDRKEGRFETKFMNRPAEIKKTVMESFENNDTSSSSILGKQCNDETDGSTETMVNSSNTPTPLTTDSDQYLSGDHDDETTAAAAAVDDCMSNDSLFLGLSTPHRLDQDISSDDEELEKEITLQEIQRESPVRKTLRHPSSIHETSCSLSCSVPLFDCNTLKETKSSASVINKSTSARVLDALLAEKEEVEVKNGDLLRIQNKLKNDIKRGGFVQVIHEEVLAEEELLPEQTKELERLQVSQSVITDVHPGETLFLSRLFLQVFDETLKPAACGFKPNNSLIDQQLNNIQPELLSDFLTSGILTMCFHRISCPDAVCRWLFYIMSIHSNSLVIHSCQQTLMDIIKKQTSNNYDSPSWTPSPLDVLKIFINYGSEKQVLIPDQNFYCTEQISDILQPSVEENQDNNNSLFLINRDNLLGILDILSFALQGRSTLVTKEITMLIEILMMVAMDKSLSNNKCHYEFQVAISSALECYSNTSWPEVVPYLCRRITNITSHHHNRVYLLQLLPPGFRGHHVQQIVAAMILHEELIGKPMKKCPETVNISSLFMYIDHMRGLIKNVELYKLSSCIMLMDLAVGSENTKSIQKLSLYRLSDMINTLKGDLRDSVQMLDQTRVKDLMVRISSKWKLMISTMGSMQKSLFPWSKQTSPQKMKVETLETKSDNESDSSDTEMSNQ